MSKLFENDSDSDIDLRTNNDYAKSYDNWRQKEELHRLQIKYRDEKKKYDGDEDSSSSSEDDDECVELTGKLEKDFFKTLSSLKNKDPKIYDENVKFFDDIPIETSVKKKKKDVPMFLKDYERKLILERGGHISDSEDEIPQARSPTYVEEQQQLKINLKQALNSVEDEEEEWGGMFKTREKSKEEKDKDDADYKLWLKGQKQDLEDQTTESELKPLKDYWNNPKLEAGEKFLRDYILNKKFMDNEDKDHVPTYDEIIHDSDEGLSEDEEEVDKQEEFEHKYNYRFEEPDQEFIKRFPRTIENSLRNTDERRAVKRAEVKERKVKEKQQKMEEIQQLHSLKKKEIEEKLKKLREITGNTEVGFEDYDIDDDFDPEAHDKRMHSLFNDEFYQGDEGDQKPEFPDLDEELEIERWDKYENNKNSNKDEEAVTHCEDEDFNMDCDYDPTSVQDELIENSKNKKRKRKSKFAKALSEPKPAFNPDDKTYEEYLDEYYKLDCEDIIGNIPCRFKYRKVLPNSFGLTVDEILKANDRELNRWCSLKKAIQYRPEHIEKYDQIAFGRKAQNEALKRKILPSLYAEENTAENDPKIETITKNKRKRGKNIKKFAEEDNKTELVINENVKELTVQNGELDNIIVKESETENKDNIKTKKKKRKNNETKIQNTANVKHELNGFAKDEEQIETNEKSKSKKKKKVNNIESVINVKIDEEKDNNPQNIEGDSTNTIITNQSKTSKKKKNKQKKIVNNNVQVEKEMKTEPQGKKRKNSDANQNVNKKKFNKTKSENNVQAEKKKESQPKGKKRKNNDANQNVTKKKFKKNKSENSVDLSDARLEAFGFKPKKFKNKLKYGQQNN